MPRPWIKTATSSVRRARVLLAVCHRVAVPGDDDVPAQSYTLRAPGFDPIVAVRFESDPRLNGVPFAAFSTFLIEQITFVPAETR